MKKNIIMLLIFSILAMQFPAVMVSAADDDARELVTFNMASTLTSSINEAKVYNNSLAANKAKGLTASGGKRIAWTDINYSAIQSGSDWVGFSEELKNSASKDFTNVKDYAQVVYKVNAASTVDLNNLYLTVHSTNGAITGIAATQLLTDAGVKDGYNIVKIALKDFTGTNAVEFVTGKTFDISKFNGMGIVRKKADNPAESSGKINFMHMSVVSIPAVTDVAATVKSGIRISFTKPTITTIDKYEIVRTNGDNTTTFTLTDDDLILSEGKYIYVDTTAEAETEYSYKVRIHESEYDLYSPYSTSVTAEIGEEDGGTELPADGASTVFFDIHMAQCDWGNGAAYSTPSSIGGSSMTNGVNASSINGMGSSGKVQKFTLNPANFKEYSSYDEPGTWQQKVYRGYMASVADYAEAKGGENGNESASYNISSVKETGYAIFKVNIDENVPLEQLYFTLSDSGAGTGNKHKDSRNYVAVPVSDYYTEADRGTTKYVAIPLTDFAMTNTRSFRSVRNNEWDTMNNKDLETDLRWTNLRGMGFLRRVRNGNNDESDAKFDIPEYTDGFIYCGEALITNLTAPTDFNIYDVKENKVILKWEHTADAAVKYNIYRTEGDGERTLIDSTTKDQYVDSSVLTPGVTYTYEIEAVDKYGTKSPMKSDSTVIRTVDHPRKFKAATLESATSELAVNITWEPAQFGDVKNYRLYKDGELYKTFASDATSFTDTELVEHSEYTYAMSAVDTSDSESIMTNPITVTASCLAKPSNLEYSVKNLNKVELSWEAPSFAEKYYIYLNGTQIADTTETSYTVSDVDYDTALVFGVRAVNAVNSTSNEAKTAEFIIKNPELTSSMVIFDDALNSELVRQPSVGVTILETKSKSIIGEKSLSFDFTTRKASTITGSLAGTIDIQNYRENGAHLGMWIWADENTDFSKLEIGVSMSGKVAGSNATAYSTVAASDYVSKTGGWVYADIPLKDIPDACQATANGITQTSTMDYAKVTGYVIRYNNSQQEKGPIIYIDQITIDTGAEWSVADVRDNNATQIDTTAAADIKSINITFTEEMDSDTFTTNGISLSCKDGEETKYVNFYGEYNAATKTYTMNLFSGLNPNTEYTINMTGVTSALGMGGTYTKKFTTGDGASASIEYTVPDIAAVMTTATNGSVTTLTIAMPEGRKEAVKDYNFVISYNSDIVALNGDRAIQTVPTGASTVQEAGKITVSGTRNGNNLSGNLFVVEFTPVVTGTANVSITGSVAVYNATADMTATAAVNGSKSFAVTSYTPSGSSQSGGSTSGGSVGGGNASNAADRVNGATPATNPGIAGSEILEGNTAGNADNFTDIDSVPWAKEAILHLAKKGYINGYDDGTYKPNDVITREQFAKIIVMVLGYSTYHYDEPAVFDDVDQNAWYADYITIAVRSGLMNGISDDEFGAGMPITRQDMCTIIYRAIKSDNIKVSELYSDIQFEDAASDYAQEAIRQLFRYGLVNGVGDNKFDPFGDVTRAMAAKVLYQLDLLL